MVKTGEDVVPIRRVRELEIRVDELERLPGRKTMESGILREALEQALAKDAPCACRRRHGTVPGEGCGRSCSYRRVTAPLNRARRSSGEFALNQKRLSLLRAEAPTPRAASDDLHLLRSTGACIGASLSS